MCAADAVANRRGTVESIRASHVMEHIPAGQERIDVMNEAHRVLKPGGTFEIIVPLAAHGRRSPTLRMFHSGAWNPSATSMACTVRTRTTASSCGRRSSFMSRVAGKVIGWGGLDEDRSAPCPGSRAERRVDPRTKLQLMRVSHPQSRCDEECPLLFPCECESVRVGCSRPGSSRSGSPRRSDRPRSAG